MDYTTTHFPLGALLFLVAFAAWYKYRSYKDVEASGIKELSMTCPFCGLPAKRDTGPNGGETYSCASHVWGAEVQRLASRLSVLSGQLTKKDAKLADVMTRLDVAQAELDKLKVKVEA